MGTIILLALIGFILIVAEMFLPGMILGILGAILLVAAIVTGYTQYGLVIGTVVFGVIFVVATIGFVVWMAAFPHTGIGRRLTLAKTLQPGAGGPVSALLGKEGVAITPLRPAGRILIDGQRRDVIAEGRYIEQGETVTIARAEGSELVVRKKA